jgi:hypothetical protein
MVCKAAGLLETRAILGTRQESVKQFAALWLPTPTGIVGRDKNTAGAPRIRPHFSPRIVARPRTRA